MTQEMKLSGTDKTVRVTSGTKRGGAYTKVNGKVVSGRIQNFYNFVTGRYVQEFQPTGINASLVFKAAA
jgi:hypothetical protein